MRSINAGMAWLLAMALPWTPSFGSVGSVERFLPGPLPFLGPRRGSGGGRMGYTRGPSSRREGVRERMILRSLAPKRARAQRALWKQRDLRRRFGRHWRAMESRPGRPGRPNRPGRSLRYGSLWGDRRNWRH